MEACKVSLTDSQGSTNPYFVLFVATALLSTAALISIQVYLNSTSQEKKGTIYVTFDMFSF